MGLKKVKIIRRKKNAVLVEFAIEGCTNRVILPHNDVTEDSKKKGFGFASDLSIERGIQYGESWEDILDGIEISSEQLAQVLRSSGIWTIEEARTNPQAVHSALMVTLRPVLASIHKYKKD